ncbi:MAG: hypothetical protein ACRDZU_01280 [Acidimicrobiales bacterium]
MRVVLCDEDALLREMVEALVTRLGHEIVGIAATTVDGVGLINAARPDLVIYDLALGYNTDFDVVGAALAVEARTIIFSHTADDAVLSQYSKRPMVVPKPDLVHLEAVLGRLEVDDDHAGAVVEQERRRQPAREIHAPPSMGVTDAQAFYEALQDIAADDALLSIEPTVDGSTVAPTVLAIMRGTDRLLASLTAVRVFLPGAGADGTTAFLRRLAAAGVLPPGTRVLSIVVRPGEGATDAFERLKHEGVEQPLP